MTDAKEIFKDPEVSSFKVRYQRGALNVTRTHVRCHWCGGFGFDSDANQDIEICGECQGSGFTTRESRWEDD